ncbi:MAG: DEAD/DEAH box helicase [Nannocystaceae bacterium]|nr:DEAD/DEAH box helicase [bacterium]
MPALATHIKTALSAMVIGTTVTTLIKAIRRIYGPKALPTTNKPNARVREACDQLVAEGQLVRQERGHTYYRISPEPALAHLAGIERSLLTGLRRALEDDRAQLLGNAPSWWLDARVALVLGDERLLQSADRRGRAVSRYFDDHASAWLNIAGHVPPPGLLEMFADELAVEYCTQCFELARHLWVPIAPEVLQRLHETKPKLRRDVAGYLALRGEYEAAREMAGSSKETQAGVEVIEAFFERTYEEAAEVGLAACASLKRKNKLLTGEAGLVHTLACIAASASEPRGMPHAHAAVMAGASGRGFYDDCYDDLLAVVAPDDMRVLYGRPGEPSGGMQYYVRALCTVWTHDPAKDPQPSLPAQWSRWRARASSTPTLGRLFGDLESTYSDLQSPKGLAGAFVRRAAWEVMLDVLEVGLLAAEQGGAANDEGAIVWVFAGRDEDLRVECKVRSPRSRKGRTISLMTLLRKADNGELAVSAQDQAVLDACAIERDDWTGKRIALFTVRALRALEGHPGLEDAKGNRLQLRCNRPKLVLTTHEAGATLSIDPPKLAGSSVALLRDGDEVGLYERPQSWAKLLAEVPSGRVEVPAAGVARLEGLAASLAEREAFDVDGLSFGDREVDADPRLLARLDWNGLVLKVELRAAPFGVDGPHYPVGEGSADAVRKTSEGLVGARRDLADESRRARELFAALPGEWDEQTDRVIGDLPEALALVEALEDLGEAVMLAWPAKNLRVRRGSGGADALKIKVAKAEQWFSASLSFAVDEHLHLDYATLMGGRENGGRFIALGDDEYLAITQDMARRLDALRAFASERDNVIQLHPAIAESLALTEATGGVTFDKAAKAQLAAFAKARSLDPRLPRSFRGTLRDYQREGFRWLARLCAAGLGGCLADDMGLGKTVQSLALLCLRKKEGPALVVCPTSVAANWRDECARFAPSLRVVTLEADGRAEAIASLSSGDVLITSYGLMVREQESLCAVKFGTAIFDEAHALKTATSKRAKAAFALDAKARVTLTGTPIENHLGELWSVMHATVPGLLGSKRRFDERLGRPVLRHEAGALDRLRAILDPFVLRRRRSEVLRELPELTEITVRVPPTDAQAAFYEVIRARAMKRLEASRKNPKKGRIEVLAEIMRLRQAAIDPRLLGEDLAPAGSKLDEACERIAALAADGHRCLVFTQFLGCIAHLDERLGDLGLDVLTLDGSTPAALRKARIDAFQAGEADAFIMSLKAGGVGINLTAAQYVIHMDPWWNPAVEEQATARSHRMGQRDPVTVYRLITEGSIEEQILELHEQKRSLAEDLLGGMEAAVGLDLEALRKLVTG